MKCLVGYTADSGGRESLALGRLLAQIDGVALIVCTVVPSSWGYPSPARVDAEYEAFLAGHAQRTLDQARTALGDGVRAQYIWRSAPSATEGLSAAAVETEAGFVILGSARHGPLGRFTIGSVTHDIFYAVSVPVILAPRGYRSPPTQTQLKRLTCIYVPSPGSRAALDTAVKFCRGHGLPLRIATLMVRDKQMYPSGVGYRIENLVSNVWKTQAVEAQEKVVAGLPPDLKVSAVIGDGPDWKKSLDSLAWEDAELLVIGSRVQSTVARLLLGPNSARIIRSSPVPVVVVPLPAGNT
jgi:nucleotide-binding universal stress UspA family protein